MATDIFADAKNKLTVRYNLASGGESQFEVVTDGPHAIFGTLIDIINGKSDIDLAKVSEIKVIKEVY